MDGRPGAAAYVHTDLFPAFRSCRPPSARHPRAHTLLLRPWSKARARARSPAATPARDDRDDPSRARAGAAEEAGSGPGGEALALLELGEAGEFDGAGGAAAEAEADRQRALEAGTAAKLLRAEGDFAAAKADWEVRRRPNPKQPWPPRLTGRWAAV